MISGTAFFRTPERILALQGAAARWLGTPFAANSESVGFGVSCQFLASAIYRETGCMDVHPPEVDMAHAEFSTQSLVEPWLDAHPRFASVPVNETAAGDLIGFRLKRAVHHVGVVLRPGDFVHSIAPAGVTISCLFDATWMRRLARAWRPIE